VDATDNFMKVMTNFYNDAQKTMTDTEATLASVKTSYTDLLKFYGYKGKDITGTDPSEFFGTLAQFFEKCDKVFAGLKKEAAKKQPAVIKKGTVGQKISNHEKGEDAMTAMVSKIKSELANKK